jgi:hypothetical protein
MVPDPLGDVGLRSHHALIERALPGELKIFFLAIGRIGDGTDGQDDFDHSDGLYPKTKLENVTPNSSSRLELPVAASRILSDCNRCHDAYDCVCSALIHAIATYLAKTKTACRCAGLPLVPPVSCR